MYLAIDFGTCNTKAALVIEDKLILVQNPFKPESSFFRSSVYLTPEGQILVGHAADAMRDTDVRRYRKEFKRDFGENIPYQLGDRQLLPQDLVGAVLSKIKEEAERIVQSHGENSLTNVVLTVPASYNGYKKGLMQAVAEQVGFTKVQLLAEPEAAAYYYNRNNIISNGDIVLVYDLGGGTFDAALLRKEGDGYKSLVPPTGIDGCGGIDFDKQIYQRICGQITDSLLVERLRIFNDVKAQQDREILGDFCRGLKHQLSQIPKAFGRLILDKEAYGLTQRDFNLMVGSVIDETVAECVRLVKDANLKLDELNHVLLVGGSCRIPYVRKLLEAKLTKPLFHLREPELAVCKGAVLFASGITTNRVGVPNMNKIKTNVKTKIIGFDLGHGETALHWTWDYGTDSSGKLLESLKITGQPDSFITAIAYDDKQEQVIAIGETAFTKPKSRNVDICFKARPDTEATQKVIKDYVKFIYKHLSDKKLIDGNQDYQILFYVGHPSGWEQENFNLYQKILAEVLPNVKVAPESRAGLMSVIKTNDVTLEELGKSVLVIDIGSSTTDFTLVADKFNEPYEESGADLGGALIDEAIYEKSWEKWQKELQQKKAEAQERLKKMKEDEAEEEDQDSQEVEIREKLSKFIKNPLQLSEAVKELLSETKSPQKKTREALKDYQKSDLDRIRTIEEIENHFASKKNNVFKSTAKLKCRQLKEHYFNILSLSHLNLSDLDATEFVYEVAEGGFCFKPIDDPNELEAIINQKLKKLGNKTWAEAFHQQLENVKNKLDNQKIEPSALFLTGGASRMGFIQNICEALFPNTKFVRDDKPELCISKGLALWGKTDYKVAGFLEEVEEFLQNDLSGFIQKNVSLFFDDLSGFLSENLWKDVVEPSIYSWRNNEIKTLNDMGTKIQQDSEQWFEREEVKEIVSNIRTRWLEKILKNDVETKVTQISNKYQLPQGCLIYDDIFYQIGINSKKYSYDYERVSFKIAKTGAEFISSVIAIIRYLLIRVIDIIVSIIVEAIVLAIVVALVATVAIIPVAGPVFGATAAVVGAVYIGVRWSGWKDRLPKRNVSSLQDIPEGLIQIIKTNNIPSKIRPFLLKDSKIDEVFIDTKPEIKSEIKKALEGKSELVNKIVENSKNSLSKLIQEKANIAKLLIF